MVPNSELSRAFSASNSAIRGAVLASLPSTASRTSRLPEGEAADAGRGSWRTWVTCATNGAFAWTNGSQPQ